MPPKNSGTLSEQRERMDRKYLRGRVQDGFVTGTKDMTELERRLKQDFACYMRAADFSYPYIAEALGVHVNTVKGWFADEKLDLLGRVAKIHDDLVGGAINHMKSYLLEIIEIQIEIMRTTKNESLASQIGFEIMDRLGLAKVNKSESVSAATVRQEQAIDISDSSGMLALAQNAPPEVQEKLAQMSQDMLALAAEHVGVKK